MIKYIDLTIVWKLAKIKILPDILYVNRSIGPTIKIILSVQDNFCQTFATVWRTFGMTGFPNVNLFLFYFRATYVIHIYLYNIMIYLMM